MADKTKSDDKRKHNDEYSGYAIHLISAWPKVLQVLNGEIPVPEVVEIFPTNYCNFECPHCRFREIHGDDSQHIELSALEEVLEEVSQSDVHTIELSGGGEPLIHPDIDLIFDGFIKNNLRVGMITNGYKFVESPDLMGKIVQCSDWVRFSVDGFTDETYQRVHGKREISYTKLRGAISRLVGLAGDIPKIGLKILISKLNSNDSLLAIREALELEVDYLHFKFLGSPTNLALDDQEMQRLIREIEHQTEEIQDRPLHVEILPPYRGERAYQKCLMTFLHAMIDWDGEIYVCAFFEHRKKEHSIGNIYEGGFFKHWYSRRHMDTFNSIDPAKCIPNCPMLRYNPVIELIKSDHFRFRYI